VVNGGILAEVDAGGAGVGYSSVGGGKAGKVGEGWAAGQGDSEGHFVYRLREIRGLRLSCCCYIWPRASGGLVGYPVLLAVWILS
jgi:hypothetical protein